MQIAFYENTKKYFIKMENIIDGDDIKSVGIKHFPMEIITTNKSIVGGLYVRNFISFIIRNINEFARGI